MTSPLFPGEFTYKEEDRDMVRRITGAAVATLCTSVMLATQPGALAAEKKVAAKSTQSVTLTGCLRADGSKYMLTDLKGTEAPKGRTWKTAFITKSTKNVEVVSNSSGPKLKEHVGRQVTVVGVRDGSAHVRASSIKRVAASCS